MVVPSVFSYTGDMSDYDNIEKAILYLDAHYFEQPDLHTVARAVGLSAFHFHRLFSRWAGITPKDFLQFCTASHAKHHLKNSRTVLESALSSGLSGPSRLHDLLITLEGATPGEYKNGGAGLVIAYGFHPTPFGRSLIGLTKRGICFLAFVPGAGQKAKRAALKDLRNAWPQAQCREDAAATKKVLSRLLKGRVSRHNRSIKVFARGTPFQLKVWEAVMKIPLGKVVSYQDLARLAGHPGAARAVGSALAHNSICYAIPCHRVIRQTGVIGEYRWGRSRKLAMLAWEFSANHPK